MNESNDLAAISTLTGMTVLSLSTGNKLGQIADVYIDPVNGRLLGLRLTGENKALIDLPYEKIFSFGRDAVMAESEEAGQFVSDAENYLGRPAKDLFGTKIVMESGVVLGEIADVLVTLQPPPTVFYEVRQSMLDRLLGRTFFIPASIGYVLSDDAARLLVPDITAEVAVTDANDLGGPSVEVRSISDTLAVNDDSEDVTLVRDLDEDATVLRRRDD
ncbi:MAG: PRC-barrel domain-containing protein [Pyrinomonadaceae bacterium]